MCTRKIATFDFIAFGRFGVEHAIHFVHIAVAHTVRVLFFSLAVERFWYCASGTGECGT